MKSVEKVAKTIDEAIEFALIELGIDRKNAEIEILEEGNKGIFSFFGAKDCRVRVSTKNAVIENAQKLLKDIFDAMNIKVDMEVNESSDSIEISLDSPKNGILIGRRGETLDALQYLVSIAVNRDDSDYKRIILDSENYRKKRKDTLIALANRIAAKVARDKKNVTLEPMNSHERRIIHATLQNNKYVVTSSIGEEPNRRLVISYKK